MKKSFKSDVGGRSIATNYVLVGGSNRYRYIALGSS